LKKKLLEFCQKIRQKSISVLNFILKNMKYSTQL